MAGRPSHFAFYGALFSGVLLLAVGFVLLYILFDGAFMGRFIPAGRPSTYDLIVLALAWAFALSAPAFFGLMGASRLMTARRHWRALHDSKGG